MKYDVEYVTSIYITARGIEADSLDEAIEKADAQWHGKYPVVAEPSGSAPWLSPDDVHVSKDWEVNYDGMDDEDEGEGRDDQEPCEVNDCDREAGACPCGAAHCAIHPHIYSPG